MRWRAAAAAAVLGGVALGGVALTPHAAAEGEIVVSATLAQPVAPILAGEPFTVELSLSRVPREADVTITIYPALDDLGSIGKIAPESDPLSQRTQPLIRAAESDARTVTVNVTTVRDPDDDGLWVPGPGVYPVELSIVGDGLKGRLVTSLIDLGRAGSFAPLLVAPVVTIGAPLVVDAVGTSGIDAAGLDSVAQAMSALAGLGNLPATAIIEPAALEALDRQVPDVVDRLVALIEDRQVVSPPYVPLDLVAYGARRDSDELIRQLAAGNASLSRLVDSRLDTQSYVADAPLDAAAVELLADARINQLVVDERDLVDDPAAVLAFGHLVELEGVEQGPRAVVTVDHLVRGPIEELEAPEATTVLWARVALLLQASDPRVVHGVVLTEDGVGGAAFANVADFLGSAPAIVRPVTVDELFDQIAAKRSMRRFEDAEPADIDDRVQALADARLHAAAIGTMLPNDDTRPAGFTTALLIAADRRLESGDRGRIIDAVRATTDDLERCLVPPPAVAISLFDRSADLRLVFDNTCEVPLTVVVVLRGDRLRFPNERDSRAPSDTSIRLELAPGTSTEWIPRIEAATPGQLKLSVELFTPSPILVPVSTGSEITVNVRANSGLGVIISVVAGTLLAGWWVLHLRQRWRSRRSAPAGEST